jgi:hypothetical protein
MIVRLLEARYRSDHRIWLRFEEGVAGEVDLAGELDGEVFEPLRDPAFFARFVVDETLTWPSGADFAPEFLHARVSRLKAS